MNSLGLYALCCFLVRVTVCSMVSARWLLTVFYRQHLLLQIQVQSNHQRPSPDALACCHGACSAPHVVAGCADALHAAVVEPGF